MTAPGRIVVVGSINTDMVIRASRLPVPGETILGGDFFMNPGGKGANQAVAAARMGGQVAFVAKTGSDVFGREALSNLAAEKISTEFVFSDPGHPSGIAMITVDSSAENTIVVAQGANAHLNLSDIDRAISVLEDANLVLMQLEIPLETVEYVAEMAFSKGIRVVLNPAPAKSLPDSLFQHLFMIILNRSEAGLLSGLEVSDVQSAWKAAERISKRGVGTVIITLGADGVAFREGERQDFVEAFKVDAVDTTAAGDTFCGALCVALTEELTLRQSIVLAAHAAAISATRPGAQNSIPFRHEL